MKTAKFFFIYMAVVSMSLVHLLVNPWEVSGRMDRSDEGKIVESRTGEIFPSTYYLYSDETKLHFSTEEAAFEGQGSQVRSMRCIGAGVRTFFTFKIYTLASYVNLEDARVDFYSNGPGSSGGRWGGSTDGGTDEGTREKDAGEPGGGNGRKGRKKDPEPDAEFFSWFIHADFPKHFVMRFCRDVTKDRIRDSFRKGLEKNIGDLTREDIAGDIELLLGFCREDLARGEEVWVSTLTGGTVRLHVPQRGELILRNRKIADGLIAIWLGEKPISKSMKKEMILELPRFLLHTGPPS